MFEIVFVEEDAIVYFKYSYPYSCLEHYNSILYTSSILITMLRVRAWLVIWCEKRLHQGERRGQESLLILPHKQNYTMTDTQPMINNTIVFNTGREGYTGNSQRLSNERPSQNYTNGLLYETDKVSLPRYKSKSIGIIQCRTDEIETTLFSK